MEPVSAEHHDRDGRLRQIASREGVQLLNSPQRLAEITTRPRFMKAGDKDLAKQLLTQLRAAAIQETPSSPLGKLFRSDSKKEQYTRKEINAALNSVVQSHGFPGVAEALLDMGADVNIARCASTNLIKKLKGKDQRDTRSEVLLDATRTGQSAMVSLLAYQSDQVQKDQSLQIAISQKNTTTMQTLLSYKSNSNTCLNELRTIIRHGDVPMVDSLLWAPIPLEPTTMSACLLAAVESESFDTVAHLVREGADADHESALAFERAVRKGRKDMSIAMVMCERRPSVTSLDRVVGIAMNIFDRQCSYSWIEILLSAGAKGYTTAASLIEVVKNNDARFARLFIDHDVSINHDDAAVVKQAVTNGNLPMTQLLLRAKLDSEHATTIFSRIPKSSKIPLADRGSFIRLLLNANARGEPLNKAVVQAAQDDHPEAASDLLDHGACVDYSNGASLAITVKRENLEFVDLLLERGNPSQSTLSVAFSSLRKSTKAGRLRVTKALLSAGWQGDDVGAALMEAVKDRSERRDPDLISALVFGAGDLSKYVGEALIGAAVSGDIHVLKILLQGNPPSSAISAAITDVIASTTQHRYEALKLLLGSGATGEPVSKALVAVIDDTQQCVPFVKLSLKTGKANVNADGGSAVCRAATVGTTDCLELITTNFRPSPDVKSIETAVLGVLAQARNVETPSRLSLLLKQRRPYDLLASCLLHEIEISKAAPESSLQIIHTLLVNGADVNYNGGLVSKRLFE